MADHYVDSAAAGGGDGTIGTPWNTLAQVAAHEFAPGDNIYLKCGSLFRESLVINQSGTEGSPITYAAYDSGAQPIISGSEVYSTWSNVSGHIWKTSANAWNPGVVLFDGTYGYEVALIGDLANDKDFFWFADEVYVHSSGGDPSTVWTSPGVEIPSRARGIWANDVADLDYITIYNIEINGIGRYYAWTGYSISASFCDHWTIDCVTSQKSEAFGFSGTNCNYVRIVNNNFQGFANTLQEWGQAGVRITGDSAVTSPHHNYVYNNTINYYGGSGVNISGYSNSFPAENNEVCHNDLSHNASGVYPSKCNSSLFHHNICDDNVQRRVYQEEYGLAVETGQGNEWYNNIVTNGRVGIELWGWESGEPWPLSGSVDRNKIYNNFFSGNSLDAIHIYEGCSDDSEIYNNIIIDNDGGIFIYEHGATGTGNVVYNNTLYNNTGDYPNLYLGGALAGWTFRNNLSFSLTDYCLRSPNAAMAGTHENNLYYRASGNVIENDGTDYTLAQVTTFEATAIAADPKLVNAGGATAADYKIASDSPCINAGLELGLTGDYFGNLRPAGTAHDIGGHEYVAPGYKIQESFRITKT